jgi:hypothetical protein
MRPSSMATPSSTETTDLAIEKDVVMLSAA